MNYIIAADTDIGNVRETNQDSVAALVADTGSGPVAFGVVCDGMGGLAKGELASATLISTMVKWFKETLPQTLVTGLDDNVIRAQWTEIIRSSNEVIKSYGTANGYNLGTTIAAILITHHRYYIVNVGDSRIYEITDSVKQPTEDQTVVARELKYGRITEEQAKTDPRQSVLLQCVGASQTVNPEFFFGTPVVNASYMLCSDGFRHQIGDVEMLQYFSPFANGSAEVMTANIRQLINLNKQRMEKDNITAALIRTF